MENQNCIFLGIKVKPGPIERHKLENYSLENTVDELRNEAVKKTNIPSESLELVHHGKILKCNTTLQDNGVKIGEMVHVVKKKECPAPSTDRTYSDAELLQIITSLRTFGCTPNAPGWTRAMQVLNDEANVQEITDSVPSLNEGCETLSILHEVELLAALGNNVHTMRRAATARPDLPDALRHLTRLVRSRSGSSSSSENLPTSGFAYSLEALSEDEDDDSVDVSEPNDITRQQLTAALESLAAADPNNFTMETIMQHLRSGAATMGSSSRSSSSTGTSGQPVRNVITPEMCSNAITQALNSVTASSSRTSSDTPMEQSDPVSASSSSQSRDGDDFTVQLVHMHEMGLLDDSMNVRALLMCGGDVNAAINLVFSGAIADE